MWCMRIPSIKPVFSLEATEQIRHCYPRQNPQPSHRGRRLLILRTAQPYAAASSNWRVRYVWFDHGRLDVTVLRSNAFTGAFIAQFTNREIHHRSLETAAHWRLAS